MNKKFSESFKMQAVQKALSRADGTSSREIAKSLGVGYSTLQKWVREVKDGLLVSVQREDNDLMTKERRPQDWSLQERLDIVISCGGLNESSISELCRRKGIYPHHIQQWKLDFASGNNTGDNTKNQAETKNLKNENKALKKELNRKEKALAETAALLVLQKKVNVMWGEEEDGLQ